MPADDWMLAQGTVEFREEERRHRNRSGQEKNLQLPACDRCTQGVMDATNSHWLGVCSCPCHNPGPVSREENDGHA